LNLVGGRAAIRHALQVAQIPLCHVPHRANT
jgi:hypothetical protein